MSLGSVGINENAMEEDYLELPNGDFVKNIHELVFALKKMKSEDFKLCVTKNRNDFAEWILEVYNLEDLVRKLLKAMSKKKNILILEQFLVKNSGASKINEPENKKDVLEKIGGIGNDL